MIYLRIQEGGDSFRVKVFDIDEKLKKAGEPLTFYRRREK